MTEEVLNRHTDPSGLLASVRAASDGRPMWSACCASSPLACWSGLTRWATVS